MISCITMIAAVTITLLLSRQSSALLEHLCKLIGFKWMADWFCTTIWVGALFVAFIGDVQVE